MALVVVVASYPPRLAYASRSGARVVDLLHKITFFHCKRHDRYSGVIGNRRQEYDGAFKVLNRARLDSHRNLLVLDDLWTP